MKKILLIAAMAVMSFVAQAQEFKFGYVDFNELFMLMPEMDEARATIEENQKVQMEMFEEMYKEYETKMQAYQQNNATWTPAVKEMKEKEIASIAPDKLFEVGNYECYLSEAENIPELMHEIGVCREETFRAVGEGTNSSIDTDKYDTYYRHLVLWDKEKKMLVGAYRFGMGAQIMEKYGIDGFYSNTLFRYKKGFAGHLSQSMELGRSFVVPACQKDPLALMLLIKGIMYTLIKNPQVRYLIGPVSISAWYPYFYRSLMVHYLESRQSLPHLRKFVSP